jgi:hypothetical protein
MWGLEHSENSTYTQKTVTSRIARYSYGIACSELFDQMRHQVGDRFQSRSDGLMYANNQMRWLLYRVSSTTRVITILI